MGDENGLNLDDIGDIIIDLSEYGVADDSLDSMAYYPNSYSSSGNGLSTITLGGPSGGSTSYTVGTSSSTASHWSSNFENGIAVNGNVTIQEDGDLKLGNRSLKEFMTKIEDRLAILVPDPTKLEKFESLKKAYDHYKMMEKLCEIEDKDEEK